MEFFHEITSAANLIPTILVGLVLLYWIMIIVGFIGMDAIDLDVDADLGVDGDMDFDVGGPGVFASLTHFLHMQDVPVVIVGSFFIIFWWIITVSVNHVINPDQGILVSLMILLPALGLSLFLTKLAVLPFAKGLKNYDQFEDARTHLIGAITTVTTSEVTSDFGQVELATDGPEITMNARTVAGVTLRKGDSATIIAYDQNTDIYTVELSTVKLSTAKLSQQEKSS